MVLIDQGRVIGGGLDIGATRVSQFSAYALFISMC